MRDLKNNRDRPTPTPGVRIRGVPLDHGGPLDLFGDLQPSGPTYGTLLRPPKWEVDGVQLS